MSIEIEVKQDGAIEQAVETTGYILMYLDGNLVKVKGNMSLKSLAPIITKMVMDKFAS